MEVLIPKVLWKDVKGYEGIYRISTQGVVQKISSGYILKQAVQKTGGYLTVALRDCSGNMKTKKVHRLVMDTFLPVKPLKMTIVHHIDNNPANPTIGNLMWASVSDNLKYAIQDNKVDTKTPNKHNASIINITKATKATTRSIKVINKLTGEEKEFYSTREASAWTGKNKDYIKTLMNRYGGENRFYKGEYTDGNGKGPVPSKTRKFNQPELLLEDTKTGYKKTFTSLKKIIKYFDEMGYESKYGGTSESYVDRLYYRKTKNERFKITVDETNNPRED